MVSTLLARAARWRLSDTSRNCSIEVPTPSATGHQLHGWGQWEREGQGGGGGEGCLLLRQKPRLWSCWSNEMQRVLSLGSGWGRGFWGVTTSPEEERPCQCPPPRGEVPTWGHVHMASKDKVSGHVPAVLGVQGQGAPGMLGDTRPRERFHLATLLLPCHTSLPSSASRPLPAARFTPWDSE